MKLRNLLLAACLSATFLAQDALAFEPGDIILRGGAGLIFPNDDSNSLTGLPGATVGVEDAITFAFTAGYMLTNHFAIELDTGNIPMFSLSSKSVLRLNSLCFCVY